jgi:nucleoside-diphosphate-sugar epimerase
MRILFIGGSGLISSGCSPLLVEAGHELTLLNRGKSALGEAPGTRHVTADVRDEAAVRAAIGDEHFDVVVDWVAFTPEHVAQDLRVFEGRTDQYVFISSASAYEKPPRHWLITEETPLINPYWPYSQQKIACEELLRASTSVPWTIVRPSHTYGPSQIPVSVGSWAKPYTIVDRMRRSRPVVIHGDGTSLWTLTHHRDFGRGFNALLGRQEALGEAFHITSDEALTWNQIYDAVAAAAGVEIEVVHVPTDALAAADPEYVGSLWGDKAHSAVFDNSKLRRLVPDFAAEIPFAEGIKESIAWFDADPARQQIDEASNAVADELVARWRVTGA